MEVILKCYSKALDEPESAAKFWAIAPAEDGEKVVAFPSAAAWTNAMPYKEWEINLGEYRALSGDGQSKV